MLPPESPEPGPWRSTRTPYLFPIYEAFADPNIRTVVMVCGAQMGKTEALFNVLGHRFDWGPRCPAIYISPTEKLARSISSDRFEKMLRSTASLWGALEKGHRNKVTEKFINGCRLGFAWSGSSTELSSHSAGLIVIDERDRMISDSGGEGDPVILAQARTKNYPNSKIAIVSTPTIEDASPIWTWFEAGHRAEWSWPCVHCGEWFVPRIKHLIWPKDSTPQQALDQAHMVCPACGGVLEDAHKHRMNKDGRYKIGAPDIKSTASFWISGLASPWQTFGQVAQVLVDAYRSKEQERIQAAINTYGGELFKMKGEAPEWHEVAALKLPYEPGEIPQGVGLITMGADVQKLGIYYVVRGWGANYESWLLDEGFIAGETEFDDVWVIFGRQLGAQYNTGSEIKTIDRTFVDSGYRPGDKHVRPEHAVYQFVRRFPGLAFATKGMASMDKPIKARKIDVTIHGQDFKGGLTLWSLNTDHLKSWIHSRIRWPVDQPGGWHLHARIDEDYCRQIVSEQLLVKPSGQRTWLVGNNRNNHYLDCEVNALAAAMSLHAHRIKPPPEKRIAKNVQESRGWGDKPMRQSWLRR